MSDYGASSLMSCHVGWKTVFALPAYVVVAASAALEYSGDRCELIRNSGAACIANNNSFHVRLVSELEAGAAERYDSAECARLSVVVALEAPMASPDIYIYRRRCARDGSGMGQTQLVRTCDRGCSQIGWALQATFNYVDALLGAGLVFSRQGDDYRDDVCRNTLSAQAYNYLTKSLQVAGAI